MRRIVLFLLLALLVIGNANAQRFPVKIGGQLERLTEIGWNPYPIKPLRLLNRIVQSQEASAATIRTIMPATPQAQRRIRTLGEMITTPATKLQTSPVQDFIQRSSQLEELNNRFQNRGFIPQIHIIAPTEAINDNLHQKVQRQESLSIKQDRLREKIYKSYHKLNSTERESTITGHNIYNNEYEYFLDAA